MTWTAPGGEVIGRGRWQPPREGNEDDRIEVNVEPGAQHDRPSRQPPRRLRQLGDSGRIGFALIGDNPITRSEMVPGDGCLAPPAKH